MRKIDYNNITVYLLALLIALAFTGCSGLSLDSASNKGTPVSNINNGEVDTEKVKKDNIMLTIDSAGVFLPAKTTSLFYRNLSGPLKKLYVKTGDTITAGQPVAEIDSQDLLMQIERQGMYLQQSRINKLQIAESLIVSQRNIKLAELDLNAAKRLNKDKPTTESALSLERFSLLYDQAISANKLTGWNSEKNAIQYKLDEKTLNDLNQRLAECKLNAPVSGLVTNVGSISETELIIAGREIARIAEPKYILFKMMSSDARYMQGKTISTLTIGKIKYNVALYMPQPGDQMDQNASDSLVANSLYMAFTDKTPEFVMNQPVEAMLEIKKENTLLIPKLAVYEEDGKMMVDILRNKQIESVEIQKGITQNNKVEVLSGLSEGDAVVLR